MYHVQLRESVHVVRAFNLTAEEVRNRYLSLLAAGSPFMLEGHEWEPRKTRLLIYEGPELRPDQIAMGRGWPTVERSGTDVTKELLAQPPTTSAGERVPEVDQLKERLIGRLSADEIELSEILRMVAGLMPGHRVSEQLAATEQAVWELLHQGQAQLQEHGVVVAKESWQHTLLAVDTWLGEAQGVNLAPATF